MNNSQIEHKQEHEEEILQRKIMTLYDEFSEFTDQCSFLCDAFVAVYANEQGVDDETFRGMSYYTYWMKRKVRKIKTELNDIYLQDRTLK